MPAGYVVILAALAVCVVGAALLLANALAELRSAGRDVAEGARTATTAINARATAMNLTDAQEAEIARFVAYLNALPTAHEPAWKDLLP